MQKAATVITLLVLGWTWSLEGLPVLTDPLYPTQENFDLTQYLGTWHDIAIASTCPYMQRHKSGAAIGKLVLQRGDNEGKLKVTRTSLRLVKNAWWGADVDAYVVHTNYNEYAIVIMSKQKLSGNKTTSVKLYSRTMTVRNTVLDDFKRLVKDQGMSDANIIIKQNKGDCVPGEEVATRVRRNAVPSLAPDVEGSGDDTAMFNGTEACKAAPDTGPCFGIHLRYYYNSSSMNCELFKYGGCLGNQNNFESERDCLQSCRTEAVCRLPMDAQPCTGKPPIWAFDSTAGLCVAYKSGFCQANGNKFYSKAECEEYCGVMKDGGDEFI
uniref:Alpha-1-microglobulin/bikunin precursor n=1 Tax=Neolamprologus brichardi TaxID=32507 RepID=A0A3Q4HU41_NEOBR